jgi:phenylpyruvate tautomerase PptA (4-oxalocrotonate tautomerase family)
MPLLRIDVVEGRNAQEIQALADALHRAMLKAFGVPERDRYQIISEHKASGLIAEDTGLGIPRTKNFVLIQITTRPRTRVEKENFYRFVTEELKAACNIEASDVMITIVQNTDEDWSFGHGRAQFLTGEL